MGCGCGGKKNKPVDPNAPNPNEGASTAEQSAAWWQANPGPRPAVPMPS